MFTNAPPPLQMRQRTNLTNKAVCAGQGGVDPGTYANEAAWNRVLEVVLLGKQRHNCRENRPCSHPAGLVVLANNTRTNLGTKQTTTPQTK